MGPKQNTSMLKKILIPIIILALLVLAFFGARLFRKSSVQAEVVPVATLNWGYMEDNMSIDGYVYDQDSQVIYPDVTQVISDVYVTEGQKVAAGDKLMAYDMASQQLTLQIKQVAIEKGKRDVATAQAELNALYNTTPVAPGSGSAPSIPSGSDSGSGSGSGDSGSGGSGSSDPQEDVKPEKVKTVDAWNLLDGDSIDDYYIMTDIIVLNKNNDVVGDSEGDDQPTGDSTDGDDTDDGTDTTPDDGTDTTPDDGTDTSSDDGTDTTPDDGEGTDEGPDASGETGDDEEELIVIPDAGTIDNPYRYLVTEDGRIYGSFLNALLAKGDCYAVVEIREGNSQEGELIASLLLNTKKIKEQNPDDWWYAILRRDDNSDDDSGDSGSGGGSSDSGDSGYDGTDYYDGTPAGYTKEELAREIQMKQRDIKNLDLDVRRLILDLKILQEQMEDGYVKAKQDGVVTVVGDKDNPPQDGSPFLKVDAGSGAVIQGTISELLLETITVGQEISASDWENGEVYVGKITSIDDYPADMGYYYYSGNPNSSYYGFLAYFDRAEGLAPGHYLQMTLDVNAQKEEAIYLPNAYIRSDSQGKYVMVDEEGILRKRYVVSGKSYYGYVTEVVAGLINEDRIAFPYGNGSLEGVKTVLGEGEVYY